MTHKNRLTYWGLTVLSSVLLSIPYLVPHCGFISLCAWIPLLCMDRIATLNGERHVWIYHYSAFVLWNLFTTFWVCNATVGGGIFAILANAFQMSVIFGVFRFSKRHFNGVLPYILLASMWIAWERAYFDAEISWPWLVLGNSFAGSIRSVQWYEYTGTLGGSLWIWMSNLSLFGIMTAMYDGRWSGTFNRKARLFCGLFPICLVTVPFIISFHMYNSYEETEDPFDVLIVQPNIDPYHKFEALSQQQQNAILLSQMEPYLKESKELSGDLLVIAPETFTGDIIVGQYERSRTYRRFISAIDSLTGVNMIFGASSYDYIASGQAPSHTARNVRDGLWVESHNSAMLVDWTGRTEICHKNKLVVGVEKTPYPAFFCRIDDMLGGVMGRCVGQDSVSVLNFMSMEGENIPVGCAVCYESVYGEYYTEYVRKGAEIMTVITNDAWWGDTPGYRQHLRYASLRAIETRRSIARCANTGISAMLDQRGNIVESSGWWKQEVLHGSINRNDMMTFYVVNGDITGRICTFLFWMLAAALAVRILVRNKD